MPTDSSPANSKRSDDERPTTATATTKAEARQALEDLGADTPAPTEFAESLVKQNAAIRRALGDDSGTCPACGHTSGRSGKTDTPAGRTSNPRTTA